MAKVFTLAEVSTHNTLKDLWLVINGKVYDVTEYADEHPGGDEILVRATGRDATDDFEEISHSETAKAMMDQYYVGEIDASTLSTNPNKANEDVPPSKQQPQSNNQDKTAGSNNQVDNTSGSNTKLLQFLVPLLVLGVGIGIRFYTKSA